MGVLHWFLTVLEKVVYYMSRWILVPAAFLACMLGSLSSLYLIKGNSMSPTFHDGDRVACCHVVWPFTIRYGDVVIFELNGNAGTEVLIKRIWGCPGDRFRITNGVVFVNDSPVSLKVAENASTSAFQSEIVLEPDQYFVIGDNRSISIDSRAFGPISKRDIVGLVYYRFEHENVHAQEKKDGN